MATEKNRDRSSMATYLVVVVVVLGALVAGVAILYPLLQGGESAEGEEALLYRVVRTPLQVIVTANGNVESASNIEIKCRVAGGSTIIWIVEDGKIVEEGEEIVRLDTSAVEDKLRSQRIVYEKALATQIQAQEDLEAAKIGVKEYEEGTFVEQLKQAEADVTIAMENLRSAENQLKYTERMARKGFVSSLQREADAFAVERAKLDLDAATTRRKVLVEFTKEKTLKELVAKREAAAARLRSELTALELEKVRLDRLETELKWCVITAPKKGMVVYANDPGRGRFGGGQQAQIEEGALVREGQALVRVPDLTQMQAKVTIHESRVDQIRPGMPARILIQEKEYQGKVLRVANQPEATSWFSANVKEYATTVSIEGESEGLRPGMTAKVTMLVANLNDILAVPVSAVVEQRGEFFCWVSTPGDPERRKLGLGQTNDKLIEVTAGVKEGDEVLRNPRSVVEAARQEPPFEKQFEDTAFEASEIPPPAAESPKAPPGDRKAPPGRRSFDLMQFDADKDGKLTVGELPERMQGMFDRLDANGDGAIDASEIAEMRKRFRRDAETPQ